MHVRLSLKLASNKNAKADARKLRDIHCMQTSFAGSLFTRREAEEREPVKFWFTESFSFLFFPIQYDNCIVSSFAQAPMLCRPLHSTPAMTSLKIVVIQLPRKLG